MDLITTHISKNKINLLRRIDVLADSMGYGAFLVGGTVRDLMLGVKNLDLDISVEGNAIELGEKLAKELGASLATHKMFGTCTLFINNNLKLDFATARKEIYKSPAALPIVEFSSLKADLSRRDFTINAMAMSLKRNDFGQLIDLFGGERDLARGLMRVIHAKSFTDDPTRIFRAVRFESRFGFSIEAGTLRLMKTAITKGMLAKLSKYRINKEIILILREKDRRKAFDRLEELGAGIIRPSKL